MARRLALALVLAAGAAGALAPAALSAPGDLQVSVGGQGGIEPSTTIQILVLLTVFTLLPSILIMTTGFARILIVLGFLRSALGTPQMPPNQILVGLALFLTLFVMSPTLEAVNETAVQPYVKKQISQSEALDRAQGPVREFMFAQTSEKDIALFVDLADMKRPQTRADVPMQVLMPAFLISELKTAFEIGFLIYIPFLIIDMVVASVLMGMGMVMLPPVMISLPLKILLFVLVDGWHLLTRSLVESFR
ncbi:fliP: flagellar biosynthetic protein FliP [Gaiella occulta]|uniref:Flagellar biosynthetic protein FliP n=1 Tax=Gaiella occulta TaxID=1002870 RepID=A0A7M2Z1R2_9ACTN|nr:flagellar type III secretion system pore protein FliP [Gaiella occulta]RDI75995.1 fliP: flagellar biosynthetic protein FliP [Gaiella occulta]